MTIEKFLQVWSQNNVLIIEGLIGLIVLLSILMAYRTFFGNKSEESHGVSAGNGASLDAVQLEKTLQKILENQNLGAKLAANDDLSVNVDMEVDVPAPAADGDAAAEVAQLRSSLTDSQKKMEALKAQLAQAQEQTAKAQAAATEAQAQAAAAPAAGTPAPAAAGSMSSEEKEELNGKLRDLEARLAEYEIISEDIADLTRFREENDDLKKQIEALKAGGSAPAAAAPASAAPSQPEPEVVAAAPAPEPTPTPEPQSVPEPAAQDLAALADQPGDAPADPNADSLIDDDLMKEFAAAVEGQKALESAAEKSGDGSDKSATNPDDTNKLMDEFENFVGNKKS